MTLVALVAARRSADAVLARGVVIAAAAVVVISGAATIAGHDPALSLLGDTTRMEGFTTAVLVAGALVAGASAGTRGWRTITNALLATAAVVTVVGWAQVLAVVHHDGRPTSTLGNASFLGAFLCLALPIALGRVLAESAVAPRRSFAVLAIAMAGLVVATGTRGAWAGAAIGVGFVLWQWAPARGRRMALLGVAAAVAAMAFVFAPSHGDPGAPDTARGRVDSWALGARAVADRPVLGWGPDDNRVGVGRNLDAGFVRKYGLRQLPDRVHNRFLDVATSTGAAGLAADVAFIALSAVALRRAVRHLDDANDRLCVLGVAGGLVAWLFQGQFLFDTFDISIVAFVLLGSVFATGPPLRPVPVRTLATWMLVPIAGVAWIGALNVVADRRVQAASGRAPTVAFARLSAAIDLRPRALDAYLFLGAVARGSGDVGLLTSAHARLAQWRDDEVVLADAEVLEALAAATHDERFLDAAEVELRRLVRLRPADRRVRAALIRVRHAKLSP